MELQFTPWPKIPRLRRDMTITEKIDGTNAAVGITEFPFGYHANNPEPNAGKLVLGPNDDTDGLPSHEYIIYAQSRKRLITPEDDNYGFAKWAFENKAELASILGPGLHFGEWWGQGIQRGYGLDHKRFSLFNTHCWGWLNTPEAREAKGIPSQLWSVPVLYEGPFEKPCGTGALAWAMRPWEKALDELELNGSKAVPGFQRAEGIIVYHHAAKAMFKVTLEGDDSGKGQE